MSYKRLLSHSDTFLLISSCSEGYLYVLSNSLKFWGFSKVLLGVLIGIERF